MTMFTNLHTLRPGLHMYTAWVGDFDEADEIDFTTTEVEAMKVKAVAEREAFAGPDPMYDSSTQKIMAIADQCCGYKLWSEPGIG